MKKILFFAMMLVVALCSTTLISCGDEEDDPTGFPYSVDIELTSDVFNAYEDLTVTVQAPGTPEITKYFTTTKCSVSGACSKRGQVKVTVNGKVRANVDDETLYVIGIEEIISVSGHVDFHNFEKSYKGIALKTDFPQLSDLSAMSNSVDF